MSDSSVAWSNVDQTQQPTAFIEYLATITGLAAITRYKQTSYQLLRIQSGARILDVGCGIGDDARNLAMLVGADGLVIGVDNSQKLIEEAQQRTGAALPQLQFRVEDAQHLHFTDNTFDGCRADRLFMHLPNREAVLQEMIRVTRPGGWIVITDPDWDTLIIDAPDRQLTRKILHASADTTANPWSGRELYRLFQESGLGAVTVADTITLVLNDWATANQLYELDDTVAAMERSGSITAREAQMWLNLLQQADHDRQFFCAVTAFTIIGQKLLR